MLVLEIAIGVFLGLLLYRGLDSFCKRRNLTMPAGVFAILLMTVVIVLPVPILMFGASYIYGVYQHREWMKVRGSDGGIYEISRHSPPGYLYVRATQRITEDHPQAPLLRGGHCTQDCDTDHSLWLVPVPSSK